MPGTGQEAGEDELMKWNAFGVASAFSDVQYRVGAICPDRIECQMRKTTKSQLNRPKTHAALMTAAIVRDARPGQAHEVFTSPGASR